MKIFDGASHKDVFLDDCGLKAMDDQPGIFTGYASVFNKKDLQDDIMDAGAFARTIKRRGSTFPLLYQHDPSIVIGDATVEEDSKGLKVTRGELVLEVRAAADAYALIKRDKIKGMSIGFRTVKDQWDKEVGVRHLKEVDLWEVSIVTFPANPSALVRTIKSGDAVGEVTRAMILQADKNASGLAHLSAAIFGASPEIIPDNDMSFARGYAEELYRKSGHSAPWLGMSDLDDMVDCVTSLLPFARVEVRKNLRDMLDSSLNPSSKDAFNWDTCNNAPELIELREAIDDLTKLAADIKSASMENQNG